MLWLVAVVAAVGFTAALYAPRPRPQGWPALFGAACRAVAVLLAVALLVDAPAGASASPSRWVALDVSESMRRDDGATWRAAAESLRIAGVGAESVFVFGDSVRPRSAMSAATDHATGLRRLADRAASSGRPLTVITDGELDDPETGRELPAGSRIVRVARPDVVDIAVIGIDAPRAAVAGDTALLRVTVGSGAVRVPSASLEVAIDGRRVSVFPLTAMGERSERQVDVPIVVAGGARAGTALITALVRAPGDGVPRNDSVSVSIDRSVAASAVLVSSAPDFDSRYALSVLRGSLAIATRAYFRVAPGQWRLDGPLAPVPEAEVRRVLAEAPVAIIHGDTMIFGPPRAATHGPIALIPTGGEGEGEWYAAAAPSSPLSPALAGLAWDSLPPLAVGSSEPMGEWRGIEARRGRGSERRAIVTGSESPRRTVVVGASGLWRWRFRGGAASDAFAAVWGSIFDWLALERADHRAAVPDAASFRAGEAVRWRRGSASDTSVTVVLARRNAPTRADTIRLRFDRGSTVVQSPPMEEGVYDAITPGGASLLVVNPSREWLPRRATVDGGAVGSGAAAGMAPGLRGGGFRWPFVAIVVLLCAEWMLRRRAGLR